MAAKGFYTNDEKKRLASFRWEVIKILSKGDMQLDGKDFVEWVATHARQDVDKLRAKRVDVLDLCTAYMTGFMRSALEAEFPEVFGEYSYEIDLIIEYVITYFLKYCVYLDEDARKREKQILRMQAQSFEKGAQYARRKSGVGV